MNTKFGSYKGSNLRLLSYYYFLVYVTRNERLGKGCPTLHTVHNRYRTIFSKRSHHTPPIAEIIWVKNVRAIVVSGFLMKNKYPENLKKIVVAV